MTIEQAGAYFGDNGLHEDRNTNSSTSGSIELEPQCDCRLVSVESSMDAQLFSSTMYSTLTSNT
jgi:hypothetical protein